MTRENIVFFFCMEPSKLLTMMDGISTMMHGTDQVDADLKQWADCKAMDEGPAQGRSSAWSGSGA